MGEGNGESMVEGEDKGIGEGLGEGKGESMGEGERKVYQCHASEFRFPFRTVCAN